MRQTGLEGFIHFNLTTVIQRYANLLQPQSLSVTTAAIGPQQDIRFELPAGLTVLVLDLSIGRDRSLLIVLTQLDTQLLQLLFAHDVRRVHHQLLRPLRFRERDDVIESNLFETELQIKESGASFRDVTPLYPLRFEPLKQILEATGFRTNRFSSGYAGGEFTLEDFALIAVARK